MGRIESVRAPGSVTRRGQRSSEEWCGGTVIRSPATDRLQWWNVQHADEVGKTGHVVAGFGATGSEERTVELSAYPIEKPDGMNVIVGQAHFVKTIEDLHEALAGASPQLRFGIAFCEASGPCLIRCSGNEEELIDLAARNAEGIAAGHSFIIFLREGFPVNVLNAIKNVPEVCTVFCATANPVEVLVAQTDFGRGIIGVIDGLPPAGIETDADVADRKHLLRSLGYKL
jgi:adenosine/AMP kinase